MGWGGAGERGNSIHMNAYGRVRSVIRISGSMLCMVESPVKVILGQPNKGALP